MNTYEYDDNRNRHYGNDKVCRSENSRWRKIYCRSYEDCCQNPLRCCKTYSGAGSMLDSDLGIGLLVFLIIFIVVYPLFHCWWKDAWPSCCRSRCCRRQEYDNHSVDSVDATSAEQSSLQLEVPTSKPPYYPQMFPHTTSQYSSQPTTIVPPSTTTTTKPVTLSKSKPLLPKKR